jgi:hypothetical protein
MRCSETICINQSDLKIVVHDLSGKLLYDKRSTGAEAEYLVRNLLKAAWIRPSFQFVESLYSRPSKFPFSLVLRDVSSSIGAVVRFYFSSFVRFYHAYCCSFRLFIMRRHHSCKAQSCSLKTSQASQSIELPQSSIHIWLDEHLLLSTLCQAPRP